MECGLCHFLALLSSRHGGDSGPESSRGLSRGGRRPLEGQPSAGVRAQSGEKRPTKGSGLQGVRAPGGGGVARWSGRAQVGTPVCGGGVAVVRDWLHKRGLI